MTKIINRLHFFVKFSTSLILIGIILFLLYLFYISYMDKISTSNNKDEFDFFEENFLSFEKSINENFDELKILGDRIIANKKSIEILANSINFDQYSDLIRQYQIELESIKNQNLKLNEKLSLVTKQLNNTDNKYIDNINYPLKNIIDLIKINRVLLKIDQSRIKTKLLRIRRANRSTNFAEIKAQCPQRMPKVTLYEEETKVIMNIS